MEKSEFKTLRKIDNIIRVIEDVGVGVSFAAIVVIVIVNVFYRYVLKSGLMWQAEVQEVLVVAMVMIGCAKVTREDGHTELSSFTGLFPRKGRVFIRALTSLAALIFLGIFFYTCVEYAASAGNLKTTMLRIPYKYFYIFLPIGMGLNLYEFLKRIPERIMKDPPPEY